MIYNQEEIYKNAALSGLIGFAILKLIGTLFSFIEVAQEINLYSFLNIAYPLNLEEFLNFLSSFRFYKNFKFFQFEIQDANLTLASNKESSRNLSNNERIILSKGISFSFLNNCSSTLILIFMIPSIILILSKILGFYLRTKGIQNSLSTSFKMDTLFFKVWSKRNFILIKSFFILFMASLQEMHLFTMLQFLKYKNESSFNNVNLIFSIVWLIIELLIFLYAVRAFILIAPEIIPFIFRGKQRKLRRPTREENKNNFPFLFEPFLREDALGITYFFFKFIKKMALTTIYIFLGEEIEEIIWAIIILYFLSYLYLRVVEPQP